MAQQRRELHIEFTESGEVAGVSKVDTKGRETHIPEDQMFEEWDHIFRRRRFPPDYYADKRLGYVEEWQGIVLEQLLTVGLSTKARREASHLREELFTCSDFAGSYPALCRYFKGYARAAEDIAPTLTAELRPFADYHGLRDMDWGFGWLLQVVAFRFAEPEPRTQSMDHREEPEMDTYITWFYVTGQLRDKDGRDWLKDQLIEVGQLKRGEETDDEERAYNLAVRFDKYVSNTVRKVKRLVGHSRKSGTPATKEPYHPIDVLRRGPN